MSRGFITSTLIAVQATVAYSTLEKAKIAARGRSIAGAGNGSSLLASTVLKSRLSARICPSYDHTVRTWQHNDGREFTGTRAEIITAFSLGDSCVSSVINRRQKSVKGWRLK